MAHWPKQRLPAPDPMHYDARQREVQQSVANGPRAGLRGPLAVWLHRPELADRAQTLGRYCRYESSLPTALSELAILVTGRVFGSEYEWRVHKEFALDAGLSAELIEAIRLNQRPVFANPAQEVVHDVARAAHEQRHIDDQLYNRAVEHLGDGGLVDLVGLLGYYTLISLTINIFKIPPLDENPEPQLPDV